MLARPRHTAPHIRFLFIAPQLGFSAPIDPASRQRPFFLPSALRKLSHRTCTYEVTLHAQHHIVISLFEFIWPQCFC